MNPHLGILQKGNDDSFILNSLIAYQKAVDTAAIVSIADKDGRIVFANDLFCEISKYSQEELLGKDHSIINSKYHPESFFKLLWITITAGKVWRGEIRNKAKDGTLYWVDTTIAPILNREGEIVQYLSIRSLITDKKALEEQKEKLLADLTRKYNELMQFNYIVSHNLRGPVGNLIGLAAMLEEECEGCSKNDIKLIRHIGDTSIELLDVIDDLNNILAVNSGEHRNRREELDILEIIRAEQHHLEREILDSGAVIEITAPEKNIVFTSVKTYLHSMFYNLISNAIKYCKTDCKPLINISIQVIKNHLIIRFKDNGIGIDLEKNGNDLFGLYKRFNGDVDGKGLGLHMTKTQIEALGGTINVHSELQNGTEFIIDLPLKEPQKKKLS